MRDEQYEALREELFEMGERKYVCARKLFAIVQNRVRMYDKANRSPKNSELFTAQLRGAIGELEIIKQALQGVALGLEPELKTEPYGELSDV